ncbi:MAG: hypothetical protein ACYS8Z_00500 [Planctomycetota bacterium]|jgi:hypothetical protein
MFEPIVNRFRENSRGFWKKYRWFIIVFTVAVLCDAASTVYFMLDSTPDTEAHPVISYMCSNWLGPVAGPLFAAAAKVVIGVAIAIYCRRFAICIFVAVSAVSFWAAWYNVWGHETYSPYILEWISW